MSLNKLRMHFEKRRLHLISRLQDKSKKLKLSDQHQLYGAIKEIENCMKSIDKEINDIAANDFELTNEKSEPASERAVVAIKTIGQGTKGFFKNVYTYVAKGGKSVKQEHHVNSTKNP